jgi:chromosome segregation ATPase
MPALFIVLGIAVLTLLALLLWFVPHLLQQQALRAAGESAQLREMLLDMLNEQEAVTLRQAQLGTSIGYLQEQLEQFVQRPALAAQHDPGALKQLEGRIVSLQQQIESWARQPEPAQISGPTVDGESWSNLMALLVAIQGRVGELSRDQERQDAAAYASQQARKLLDDLEQELDHLHSIASDITKLQWRLRQSISSREGGLAVLGPAKRGAPASG